MYNNHVRIDAASKHISPCLVYLFNDFTKRCTCDSQNRLLAAIRERDLARQSAHVQSLSELMEAAKNGGEVPRSVIVREECWAAFG